VNRVVWVIDNREILPQMYVFSAENTNRRLTIFTAAVGRLDLKMLPDETLKYKK